MDNYHSFLGGFPFFFCLSCLQYHGGTNFGRTAGGPFIATSYDYDAPLDEFGMYPKVDHEEEHIAIYVFTN
jgi:hypothetical protein